MIRYLEAATLSLIFVAVVFAPRTADAQQVKPGFILETVHDDFSHAPVGFSFLPDGRILVIHHQNGYVDLLVDGVRKEEPILVVDSLVTTSEEGLLGIAVDPDFPDSSYIYLFHTKTDSTNQISRFTVSGDLDDPHSDSLVVDSVSKKMIFSEPNLTRFHNGGTLRFGSDKTLYVSMGDDTYADSVQMLSNRNGKILRFNRDGSPASDNPPYPNEPADRLPEIFAMGLRNPYRFAIDPLTDELFIGDVGTTLYEEFNISNGGENFGYPHYEGPEIFRDDVPLIEPDPTFAVFSYPQSSKGKSALALATYRPSGVLNNVDFPAEFDGAHFFTDFYDTVLRYLRYDGENFVVDTLGTGFSRLTDGAVASDGSLYVLSYGQKLYRISYDAGVSAVDNQILAAGSLQLSNNFPEPFTERTSVDVTVSGSDTRLRLSVYDMLGREVTRIFDGRRAPGVVSYSVDLTGYPSGVFMFRAVTESHSATEMLLHVSR